MKKEAESYKRICESTVASRCGCLHMNIAGDLCKQFEKLLANQ
jgi:hypothetical protein